MALSNVFQGLFSCLIGPRKGSLDFKPSLEGKPREEVRQAGRHQAVCNYSNTLFIGSHNGDSKGTYQAAVDVGACKPCPAASNPSANADDADIIATRLHDICEVNYGEDCCLDSLICASVPSSITVFTVSGVPIHQTPTSIRHFGNRMRQRSDPSQTDNADNTFLLEVFQYEPDKLEHMLYEVMREGGGHWKGVIRIPARLLSREHVTMAGCACHSPLPWQASHVSNLLPNSNNSQTASPAVSTPPVGPQRQQRRRSQAAAAVDFRGDADKDSHPDSYPELLPERLVRGPGIEWAKSKAYSANSTLGKHVGNVLWPDALGLRPGGCLRPSFNLRTPPVIEKRRVEFSSLNASQSSDRSSFDNHDMGRWRLAAGRSRLSLAGDAAAGAAMAVAFSGSATPSMYCSLPSSLHVRQYLGSALKGNRARSLASGGGGGVPEADGDVVEGEQRPSYSCCSDMFPTRDCLLSPSSIHTGGMGTSNDHLGPVTAMPFAFSPNAASSPLAHQSSYRAAHGDQSTVSTGTSGRIATMFQRPNCRSASFSHTLAADAMEKLAGADSNGRQGSLRAHSHAHMHAHGYGHGPPSKAVCALGLELGDIPESAAANAFGNSSMGWESGGNPLATSTFGLALGRPLDGLPIAATPLSALATIIGNNHRRSCSGGVNATDQLASLPPRSSFDTLMGAKLLSTSPVGGFGRRPASATVGITRSRAQVSPSANTTTTTATSIATTTGQATSTLIGSQGSVGNNNATATTAGADTGAAPPGRTRGILRRTTSAAAFAPVWQHANPVRQNGLRQQSTTAGTSNLSRVLTFASSLKNAPAATQMLAEGSRQGSFGSLTYRSRSCVGVEAGPVVGAITAPVVPTPKRAARQQRESADEVAFAKQRAVAEQMADGVDEHAAVRLPYISYNNSSVTATGTESVSEGVVREEEAAEPEVGGRSLQPDNGALLLLSSSWLAAGAEPCCDGGVGAGAGGGGGNGGVSGSGDISTLQCARNQVSTNDANTHSTNNTAYNNPSHREVLSTNPSNVTSGDPANGPPTFSWATTTGTAMRTEMEQLSLSGVAAGPNPPPSPFRSACISPFMRPRAQQAVVGVPCTTSNASTTATNRPNPVHRLGRGARTTGGYLTVASSNNSLPGPTTAPGVQESIPQGQQDQGQEGRQQLSTAPARTDSAPLNTGMSQEVGSVSTVEPGMDCSKVVGKEPNALCNSSVGKEELNLCCQECVQSQQQATFGIQEGGEEAAEYRTVGMLARMASAKCSAEHEHRDRLGRDRQSIEHAGTAEAGAAAGVAVPVAAPVGTDGGPQKRGRMEYWHEVWATLAVDPVSKQDVIVIAQHDVSAKVIAERHLALVMEAEHRLLEQLFPKHILTHVTEEWIAEAERAAASAAAAAAAAGANSSPSLTRNNSPVSAVRCSRLRPVVRDCNALATWHPAVTLLFADIKGFTPMCKQVPPRTVMTMLNDLYSRFDAMLDRYGVFKVETIGDCYFVAGGLVHEDEDGMSAVTDGRSKRDPLHAQKVFMFAKAMLSAAREVKLPTTGESVQIRVGISSGPVVSGVVGTRMPRFCLFGDTVNTTSRMESTGVPGAIHASASAQTLLRDEAWEPTGGIEVKGKGLMQTFLWRPLVNEDGAELNWPTCATEAAVTAAKATATAGRFTAATTALHTTGTQSSGEVELECSSATLARQPTTPDCLEVLKEADFRPEDRNSGRDSPSAQLPRGGGDPLDSELDMDGALMSASEQLLSKLLEYKD